LKETYEVDVKKLTLFTRGLVTDVTSQVEQGAVQDLGKYAKRTMSYVIPSSDGKVRTSRTRPKLKNSITIEQVESNVVSVGPTKKVDGYDLGAILQLGSTNQTTIVAKNKKFLKFFMNGVWWFKRSVTRGIIAPRDFMGWTSFMVDRETPKVIQNHLRIALKRAKAGAL
jgi:hypothetical protein